MRSLHIQASAQPVHIDRDHSVARAGRLGTPHPVEQLPPADRPAWPERQRGQESLFTNRPRFQTRPPAPGLKRPEQGESKLLIRFRA
jgi:hypothetical protein